MSSAAAVSVRRRRRKDFAPDLWIVVDAAQRPIGYLVTEQKEYPRPIVFIRQPSKLGLQAALMVRRDHRKARMFNLDYRGRKYPKELIGFLLKPIDSRGRLIPRFASADASYVQLFEKDRKRAKLAFSRPVDWMQKERDALNVPFDAKLAGRIGKAGKSVAA